MRRARMLQNDRERKLAWRNSCMELPALGIDVGKKSIHVAVILENRKRNRNFNNDEAGHGIVSMAR